MALLATNLLPDEIDALKTIVEHERSLRLTAQEETERLRAQLRLLLSQRFAAKSERVEGDSPQLGLFDEAEVEAQTEADDDTVVVTTVAGHSRARGHRRPLPAQSDRAWHPLRQKIDRVLQVFDPLAVGSQVVPVGRHVGSPSCHVDGRTKTLPDSRIQ